MTTLTETADEAVTQAERLAAEVSDLNRRLNSLTEFVARLQPRCDCKAHRLSAEAGATTSIYLAATQAKRLRTLISDCHGTLVGLMMSKWDELPRDVTTALKRATASAAGVLLLTGHERGEEGAR